MHNYKRSVPRTYFCAIKDKGEYIFGPTASFCPRNNTAITLYISGNIISTGSKSNEEPSLYTILTGNGL